MEIAQFLVPTDDGESLEAELAGPEDAPLAAVLTHPHPQYGGDMHNAVVDGLFRGLIGVGVAALRFNFRSTGRSTGTHDAGGAERLDVAAACSTAIERRPDSRLVAVGYSFGADVLAAARPAGLEAQVLVAPPLHFADLGTDGPHVPTLLLVPEHDQFSTPDRAEELAGRWEHATVETVTGADHFLAGTVAGVVERTRRFLDAAT